jgi:ADP-ribose pyrophosphatase YjhB (NUDIX family)
MRALLQAVWALPWPASVRRVLSAVAVTRGLRTLLVPQFMVGVVGLIESDDGQLLVLRHTYRSDFDWGLPTGFLEHHEAPAVALRREMREEAGFEVELTELWRIVADDRRPLLDIVYRGRVVGGKFTASSEVDAMRWCRDDDFPTLRPDQQTLVHQFLQERERRHEGVTRVGS